LTDDFVSPLRYFKQLPRYHLMWHHNSSGTSSKCRHGTLCQVWTTPCSVRIVLK